MKRSSLKMKKYYKLTDENLETYHGCHWQLGVERSAAWRGELCTAGWIHVYDDPLLAIIMNPIHANFQRPRLFEVATRGRVKNDRGMKFGVQHCTLVRELPPPVITPVQRAAFGILCVLPVYTDTCFIAWAEKWLNGSDRSIEAAANAANAAANAAADALAYAANAANAAAYVATNAAANAADDALAYVPDAANVAANAAAYVATNAAANAAYVADAANVAYAAANV